MEQVVSAKLLGIVLSQTLRFDIHVNGILKLCSQRIYLLKLLRDKGLPCHLLNTVFDAVVLSKLRHAISVYHGFFICGIERPDQGRQSVSNIVRVQSPSPLLSSPPFLSPPLRSRPLNPAYSAPQGPGERCKLRQWVVGQSPSRQRFWCISG